MAKTSERLVSRGGGGKIVNIEAARGIAAILVVFFHATGIMALPKYFGYLPMNNFFCFGYAGVDFFFVLSGFIIYYAHYNDLGKNYKLRPYLLKRFIRIYPLHWLVTILFIIGLIVHPPQSFPSFKKVILSFLLLPQEGYPLGVVAWTLIHEVLFYVIFSLMILHRMIGATIIVMWGICVSLWNIWIDGKNVHYLLDYIFNIRNLEFLIGMSVGMLLCPQRRYVNWRIVGFLGVFFLVLAAWISTNENELEHKSLLMLYGVGSALVIYSLVVGELSGEMIAPSWLVFLGSASYSIYLIHFLALSVCVKFILLVNLSNVLSLDIVFIILVMSAVASGCLLHLFVERPLLAWCRRKVL